VQFTWLLLPMVCKNGRKPPVLLIPCEGRQEPYSAPSIDCYAYNAASEALDGRGAILMNRELANKLLDKARDGKRYSFEQISAALYATGDLHDPMRGEGMEEKVQGQSEAAGQGESPELVAASEDRHSPDSWAGWSRYLDCRNEQAAA
jgi:hypothetical protein